MDNEPQNPHLSNAMPDVAVIATDLQGKITVFNQGAEALLGYHSNEIIGHKSALDFHLATEIKDTEFDLSEKFSKPVQNFNVFKEPLLQGDFPKRDWTYVHKEGHGVKVQLNVSSILSSEGKQNGILFMATQHPDDKIQALSDLPTLLELEKTLNIERRRNQRAGFPLGLVKLKVDSMDSFEAHYGVEATERLLTRLACSISERIRRAGDFLSQGEPGEFFIIMPNTALPGAVKLAEQLRLLVSMLQYPHEKGLHDNFVTVSAGIVNCVPDNDTTTADFFLKVDMGINQALSEGGNCSRIG